PLSLHDALPISLCLRLLHDREHAGQRSWVIPKSILINGVSAALINIDMAIGTDGHCRNLICKRVSNMLPKWLTVKLLKPLIFSRHARCPATRQNHSDDFLTRIHKYRLFYCGIDPANVSL